MDGYQDASVVHATFVPLRLIIGDTHSNQGSNESSHCTANTQACQRSHNRAGSDQWADAWNRPCTQTCEQSQSTAHRTGAKDTSRRSLRRLGVLLTRELFELFLSAINTETSSCEKPDKWSWSTAASAALREGKQMPLPLLSRPTLGTYPLTDGSISVILRFTGKTTRNASRD